MSRECKLLERRALIQRKACELVIARGFDGFTMDDLAEAADLSRRTLFNLLADKTSAVLGPDELPTGPEIEVFVSGGPTGDLYEDLTITVRAAMAELSERPGVSDERRLFEKAIAADSKVFAMVLGRVERIVEFVTDMICRREGWEPGDLRARALATSLLALTQLAFAELAQRGGEASFGQVLADVLTAFADTLPSRS
ncbi:TetR family transcriptional regulator [Saccharopolyspora sp. NFXS83]|uniref:TetR family transcriptional regulator n=1 Tax=Saccharopolyspora sp. NFXS83 TaxID=2993560 RepID=UPI00224A5C3E|nr:TetR family transcriptional regulator [Saccharopolyspora sp. NFXS83]MCX2729525.1 TetR family transcriptional regulator [Saccharopolyspora sp. NFXS83]